MQSALFYNAISTTLCKEQPLFVVPPLRPALCGVVAAYVANPCAFAKKTQIVCSIGYFFVTLHTLYTRRY